MKKQYVMQLAVILSVGGILFSCGNKMDKNTGGLEFDSISINQTEHLFADSVKPACNLVIKYTYPVKATDNRLKDSLNSYFVAACFGDKYVGLPTPQVIKQFSENYVADYRKDLEPMYLEDQKKHDDEVTPWYSYYKSIEGHVQHYKGNLLTYRINYNEYTGGAHGMYTTTYLNINLATLRPIKLNDVFVGEYQELLTDLLWNQLMADNKMTTREELEDIGYGSTGDLVATDNFYLEPDGIVFHFNVYEFTPYAMGEVNIKLPYQMMEHILAKDNMIINELKN
ncbi:MAG: DUF3298 and DUF4163 domain-containing protein [Bacteroides graminisolvens]|nr:DUF3298 and DUF4163 domain-containing protein [Bacteroides graminisolvens]